MECEIEGEIYFIDFAELESVGGYRSGGSVLKYKGIDEEFHLPVAWTSILAIWMNEVEVEKISMDIDLIKEKPTREVSK